MGNKLSWEDAEKLGSLKEVNTSIYAKPNKYGYKINIQHPAIRPHYERYKRKLGEMILSDAQRFEFERIISELIQKGKNNGNIRKE